MTPNVCCPAAAKPGNDLFIVSASTMHVLYVTHARNFSPQAG
jgi:hypothetical protein